MEKTSYHRNKSSSRKIRKLSSKSHQISDYWGIHLEWKHTRGRVRMVSALRPAWATQTPQLRLHGKIKRVGGGKREGKIGLYNSKILSHYRTREKQECLLHRSNCPDFNSRHPAGKQDRLWDSRDSKATAPLPTGIRHQGAMKSPVNTLVIIKVMNLTKH